MSARNSVTLSLLTQSLHGLKDRGVNGETDAVVFYDLATVGSKRGGSKTPPKGTTITKVMKFLQKITGSSMKNLANSSECTLNRGPSCSKLTASTLQSSISVSPLTVIHGFSTMRKTEKCFIPLTGDTVRIPPRSQKLRGLAKHI